jgi:hypothetical protein
MGSTYSLMSFRPDEDMVAMQSRFLSRATRNITKMLEALKVAMKQTSKGLEPLEWLLADLIALRATMMRLR